MIVYNGRDIRSVANVKIEDITVSPIQINPVARERAIQFGADFVRNRGGTRTVTVSFALLDSNIEQRQRGLLYLSEWAKTDKEYQIELQSQPLYYLTGVCTQKPDMTTRKWWENKLKLVFTCFDNPFWTSIAEKTASFGTQFLVYGDAPPLMRIERTLSAAASNQSYSDGTNTMTFSTIPAGSLVIDLNKQTAAVGNSSIMQYYAPAGKFIIPKAGAQTLTGTGTIKYRERFE